MKNENDFHESHKASAVLAKVGNGCADADFARAMGELLDRVAETNKAAKLVLTLDVKPRDDLGCIEMRASVVSKLPKLPAPASQMHVGAGNVLMDQMEYMMGGGPSEAKPVPLAATQTTASGRLTVAKAPSPAPLAAAPAPAPVRINK